MKINHALMVIVLIAALVKADSEGGVADAHNGGLSVDGGSHDRVNETDDPTKKGNSVNSGNNDSREKLSNDLREKLDPKGKENEVEKGNGGDQIQKDGGKENEGSSSESENGSKKGISPPVTEKCDSSSNRCTDDDKTLVACLRVPGNESPALSLLILNRGKGSQSITISASDSVQLDRKQIELQENKDTEIKVSVRDVESGHFIVLTAGHGNCSLNFKDEHVGKKIDDHTPNSSNLSIYKLTSPVGLLVLGGIVIIAAVTVFMRTKSGRKYCARKTPKYQQLDMELLVSHGTDIEAGGNTGGNEGWDNSWGESWDDED